MMIHPIIQYTLKEPLFKKLLLDFYIFFVCMTKLEQSSSTLWSTFIQLNSLVIASNSIDTHINKQAGSWSCSCSPHCPVKAVGTEAMSTLGLEGSSKYIVTAVAQVLVLQLVTQNLLGEARFIALHGRRGGRLLCGHGVCSHVTP